MPPKHGSVELTASEELFSMRASCMFWEFAGFELKHLKVRRHRQTVAALLFSLALLLIGGRCAAAVALVDSGFEGRPDGTTFGGTLTFASTGIWTLDNGSYRSA